jgi:hypothetical protein
MFLDIFHIYIPFIFCKKKLQNICVITFHFIAIFGNTTNFGEIFKNNHFFEEIATKLPLCHDFNQNLL